MYIRKTNRKTHKKYTIEEKNQIVLLYLDRHMSATQIAREYNLDQPGRVRIWAKQYRTYGTCVDNRGKCSKLDNSNKGRPRKTPDRPLEKFSKEELIERCKMLEDIKKSFAYLESQKLKKNIK